jgi:spore germination protein GerM
MFNVEMNSRWIITGLVLVLLLGAAGYWWYEWGAGLRPGPEPLPEEQVDLYFYNMREARLEVIQRTVSEAQSESSRIGQIIEELSNSPEDESLVSLMPEGIELRTSYTRNQTVTLDFNDRIVGAARGSSGEMMFLYSIVNSVLGNLPDRYKLVQFLVEGEMRKTIGPYGEESGHIAIRYPLGPRWNLTDAP